MHNGKYQSHIQAAQQELYPHKKACLLTRNIGEFSGEKLNRMDHQQEMTRQREQEETREDTEKGHQMTACRFQTGE